MSYEKTNWQDLPNTSTPINATRLNKMETGIADANGMIGVTTYSSNSTYAVGDYCVYNNKLYRCITAITTGEAFNSSKWTETTVMNEKESILNKTTSISSSSTNTQYPSAKAVYDQLTTKENLSNKTTSISSSSTDTQYPSAKAVQTALDTKQDNLELSGQGNNITLNGTSKNKFTKLVVKGKTEQELLSGKNQANINAIQNTSIITVTNDTLVLANNTNSMGYTNTSKKLIQICPNLQVGDTVIVSFKTTSNSNYKDLIYLDASFENGGTIEITQARLDSFLVFYGGYNETAVISEFMIRKSTVTDTSYEPYCRTEFQALIQIIRRLYIMLVGI